MSTNHDQVLQAEPAATTAPTASNPDCWVSFWENDDYKGNTRTFSGAQTINDLAEYTYDGDDQEMDDSINSLKTGPSTWLCVFTNHKCEGEILRVGPNTGIKNLEDYNLPGPGDWQNTIVSFVTYDHQPNFWDATNETAPGQCWVKIYNGTRYTGERFAVRGAGEVVNTGCIEGYRYYDEQAAYWYQVYPNSLTTGPTTWVELYEDVSYGSLIARFGPNSLIPDLTKYAISQGAVRVSSLKVFEQMPADFNETEQTPNEVLTIQRYQTAQKLGSVLGDVIGMVPEVGGLLTGMLDLLWPSGPSTAEVWHDMTNYMTSLVDGLINANNLKALDDLLQGYYDDINTYVQANPGDQKADMLGEILEQLQTNQPLFLNQAHPEQDITYLVAFGSISVAMLAERAYNYELISGGQPDENPELARAKLDQAIATLSQAAATAAQQAWAWRLSQITITLADTTFSTEYVLADAYTGYQQKFSEQAAAEEAKHKLDAYVGPQYEQQLSGYVSPAKLWHYFATANTEPATPNQPGGKSFPTTLFKTKPQRKTVSVTQGGYPTTAHYGSYFQDQLNGGQLTAVELYSTEANKAGYVAGMQFQFSNQAVAMHGNTGQSGVVVALDAGETIVALYGGSGSFLDQVFFRTSSGRDFGIGGTGGTSFSAAAPQGVGAALSSLQGYAGQQIDGFTLTWQYSVYE